MLLGRTARVCQHRPKRTICKIRTIVRSKARIKARSHVPSTVPSKVRGKVLTSTDR